MSRAVPDIVVHVAPACGWCCRFKAPLDRKGVSYREVDVSADEETRAATVAVSGRQTVPRVFVDGAFIGGHDDLVALDRDGRLDALLGPSS